jgi:thiol-disulfide isomerase/thioredoxin
MGVMRRTRLLLALLLGLTLLAAAAGSQTPPVPPDPLPAPPSAAKKPAAKVAPKTPTLDEELQQAIRSAGNDRAALLRNLEAFLKKYPDAAERPQIYRALVEASLQLRDTARAAEYAERIVALSPDDMSMTLLTIELLERNGDEAALRRAVNYATRVLDYVQRSSAEEKSPRVSLDDWNRQKRRDATAVLVMRGRLHMKLKEYAEAEKDFEQSYREQPSAISAAKLGELAELRKDPQTAIKEYARAFALADGSSASVNRHEVRQKLGNVWRLVHGSEDGLGDFLLLTFDETAKASVAGTPERNAGIKDPLQFELRKAPQGTPLPLADFKGKVLVLNFWATWCGPCHIVAPLFDRVAAEYRSREDVAFFAANCDEDETLVAPYLEEEKTQTAVVFADGLDRALAVNAFPTVVILDRAGRIVYRAEGYSDERFEGQLAAAVETALQVKQLDH